MVRGMLAAMALVFLLWAVALGHVAAWFWLRAKWEPLGTALILAGADAVLAMLLLLLAARSTPSRVELEALAVRERAVESITSRLALSALAAQVLRIAAELFRRAKS